MLCNTMTPSAKSVSELCKKPLSSFLEFCKSFRKKIVIKKDDKKAILQTKF